MNLRQWEITPETITHHGKPAFTASWISGVVDLENISGVFWYDENTGSEDDRLLIYGFKWKNEPSEPPLFEELMKKAGHALDNWISERF